MLSRVADSLYWMSRYLERAEHTARLIDVQLHLMLDQSSSSAEQRFKRLLPSLAVRPPDGSAFDAYSTTWTLSFDPSNSASIGACIGAARENARQVREQISSEMWEQINRLFLHVKRTSLDEIWNEQPHEFFSAVKDGAHLFQGITDSTMSHGEGWQFIQAGRFLERAGASATLLDVHFGTFLDSHGQSLGSDNYLEWVGLLKCCTAFEAYCKVYTADLRPDRIAEFLLLNGEFPHSVRFSVDQLVTALQAMAAYTVARNAGAANRLAGRLKAALSYGQIDEIISGNLHSYLANIQRQCGQIHAELYQTYIAYPISSVLVS